MTRSKPQGPSNRCRLTLTGEIDLANAKEYLAVAQAIIAGCNADPCFTIDLSGVTFMDSTGLAMLVGIGKVASGAGMELRLDGTRRAFADCWKSPRWPTTLASLPAILKPPAAHDPSPGSKQPPLTPTRGAAFPSQAGPRAGRLTSAESASMTPAVRLAICSARLARWSAG